MAAPAPTTIAFKADFSDITNIEADAVGYLNNNNVKTAAGANGTDDPAEDVLYTGKELAWKVLSANCEVRAYDTDNDGYIELVMAYEYAKNDIKEVKTVTDSEKYGNVYGTTTANWRESTYAADATKIPESFIINADFTAEKGDKVVVKALENVFEKTATHGYVLGVVEGKVTRISTDAKTVYIDGVKYSNTDYTTDEATKVNTAPFGVSSEGTFWTYANGAVATSDTEGGVLESDTYALVYDAWVTEVKTTGANRGVTYTVEVSAILPDGTNKVFEVASITEDVSGTATTITSDKFNKTNTDAWFAANKTLGDIDNTDGKGLDTLVAYTLTDGKINLILNAPAATDYETGSAEKGVAKTSDNKLITSDSVTYVQTADKNADGGEKWVVFKGTSTPDYTVKTPDNSGENKSTRVFAKDAAGNDTAYVKYTAITKDGRSSYGETVTGFFVLLSTPDKIGTTKYVAKIYNGETNKVDEVEYTAADADAVGTKGGIYTTFGTENGFGDEMIEAKVTDKTTTNAGFITKNDDNAIVTFKLAVKAKTESDALITSYFLVDKDTKFFHVNGDNTTSYVVADLNDTISLMDDDSIKETYTAADASADPAVKESTKYNVIVVDEDNDGYADVVVTFESAQTYEFATI